MNVFFSYRNVPVVFAAEDTISLSPEYPVQSVVVLKPYNTDGKDGVRSIMHAKYILHTDHVLCLDMGFINL